MLTIILSTYKDFVQWKRENWRGMWWSKAETYHNRNQTLKVSPKTKFAQSSINATILDTIVNKLVRDLVAEFKEGNWVRVQQRSPRISQFYQVCLCKILHKTENKFRNKNKRFLFVNLNRNSSWRPYKFTQSLEIWEKLQNWSFFSDSGNIGGLVLKNFEIWYQDMNLGGL